jgi:hypothetical protein
MIALQIASILSYSLLTSGAFWLWTLRVLFGPGTIPVSAGETDRHRRGGVRVREHRAVGIHRLQPDPLFAQH